MSYLVCILALVNVTCTTVFIKSDRASSSVETIRYKQLVAPTEDGQEMKGIGGNDHDAEPIPSLAIA